MEQQDQNQQVPGPGQTVDHISNLPNELLCHILSLVPTKSAVGTCVLSKRWKYIWKNVPALDFTEMPCSERIETLTPQQIILYKSFVDKVLIQNSALIIQHLRFQILEEFDNTSFDTLVTSIMRRHIGEIILSSSNPARFVFPSRFLLVCEKLLVLKLKGFSLDVPGSLHLPLLETIHLDSIEFVEDNDPMQMLSLGCPVLKELVLDRCLNISKISVHSSILETLKIRWCMRNSSQGRETYILVNAPNLKCLHLEGGIMQWDKGNLNSLSEAKITIARVSDMSVVVELLKAISSVQTMIFTIGGIKRTGSIQLFPFANLTHLEIRADDWMLQILTFAPKLVSLVLEYGEPCDESLPFASEPWLRCLSSLQRIAIKNFRAYGKDLETARHILTNALVLTELKLHMHYAGRKREKDAHKKLAKFPWASSSCKVVICSCC